MLATVCPITDGDGKDVVGAVFAEGSNRFGAKDIQISLRVDNTFEMSGQHLSDGQFVATEGRSFGVQRRPFGERAAAEARALPDKFFAQEAKVMRPYCHTLLDAFSVRDQAIVVRVSSNPEPKTAIVDLNCQGAIVQPHAYGSKSPHLIEAQRRMIGMFTEQLEVFVG